jgi:hypothetical protein
MDREIYDLLLESLPKVSPRNIEQWEIADPCDNDEAYRICVEDVLIRMRSLAERLEGADFAECDAVSASASRVSFSEATRRI